MTAGERLREIRETLGLSLRTVEAASARLVHKHQNSDYFLAMSRLSDIETKGIVPNPHRIYSLAVIYRIDIRTILGFYGIDLDSMLDDLKLVNVPVSHKLTTLDCASAAQVPVRLDPSFELSKSAPMGRMIVKWGSVPCSYLKSLADDRRFSYGFVGEDDWTMYPLILPGSFLQIDESRRKVKKRSWKSEYERPIYFVETRQGYTCSWCEVISSGRTLLLEPHPQSHVETRVVQLGSEAEIIGQIVGVAMRLDGWTEPTND